MPRFKIDGIQPLSVNQVWAGQRFKTKKYKVYETNMLYLLPKIDPFPQAPYVVKFIFGFSNSLSDVDNGLKPLIDIMQKRYGFNDRDIVKLIAEKVTTKKGMEFIDFEIKTYVK